MIPKQDTLARMTGISRTTINALERNRLFLSSHYALLIAEALDCSLDDLYEPLAAPGESLRKSAPTRMA
jgi:DNA-binding XRE family transcriptional regulator